MSKGRKTISYGIEKTILSIHSIEFYLISISLRLRKKVEYSYNSIQLYQKLYLYSHGGKYYIGKNVQIGYMIGGQYRKGYCELQARYPEAIIHIGNFSSINNNFLAICCLKIVIGDYCRIGINCQMMDSDFHGILPDQRSYPGESKEIIIGNNVWIGNNVLILKGVTIGDNSIVGAGSVVTKSIPANEIWGGSPAHFIRRI